MPLGKAWESVDGLDARLTKLHAEKVGFSKIARTLSDEFKMDVTRNACIGRSRRLGLPRRSQRAAARRYNVAKSKDRKAGTAYRPPALPRPLKPLPAILTSCLPVTMFELSDHHCRYPVSVEPIVLFCGQQRMTSVSYCEDHYPHLFQPVRKK